MKQKKIAIIGGGISGLTAALLLQTRHQVTLFEQNNYLGGHTHTKNVELGNTVYPVNTGFIVFNDWTYPNFMKLMDALNVASEPSSMSFSVRCDKSGLEYNGTNLNSMFCQRRNLLNPQFWRMINDILRFNRETTKQHINGELAPEETLAEYLENNNYCDAFWKYYIIPMGAAIWSSPETDILNFPIQFFVRFFHNHGMLSVDKRPQWRVISGGSHSYVQQIQKKLFGVHHINKKVIKVQRTDTHVCLLDQFGEMNTFDEVVFACHSDQALNLLAQPSQKEQEILSAIPYKSNSVILHTDTTTLPKRQLGWAAWNYRIPSSADQPVSVTYNMNILQNFRCKQTFCVSLNQDNDIDPSKIIEKYDYSHPCFNVNSISAQSRFNEINGKNRTFYCGAYWANGFHEDGVNSAINMAKAFDIDFHQVIEKWKAQSLKAS